MCLKESVCAGQEKEHVCACGFALQLAKTSHPPCIILSHMVNVVSDCLKGKKMCYSCRYPAVLLLLLLACPSLATLALPCRPDYLKRRFASSPAAQSGPFLTALAAPPSWHAFNLCEVKLLEKGALILCSLRLKPVNSNVFSSSRSTHVHAFVWVRISAQSWNKELFCYIVVSQSNPYNSYYINPSPYLHI